MNKEKKFQRPKDYFDHVHWLYIKIRIKLIFKYYVNVVH